MDYSKFNVTSLGGNCISSLLNFGKKSPLNGAWAKRGILSIECIFNNQFKDIITHYNDYNNLVSLREKIYTRRNQENLRNETEYVTLIGDYEFGHIDLSLEENRNKIIERLPNIFSTNKYIYSLNQYDCLYITENNLKYVASILIENNIRLKDIVILETYDGNNKNVPHFKHCINPIFYKFFTVYRINYTDPQWEEKVKKTLAIYFRNSILS